MRLLSTPGHTRGHQSVLLRLTGRDLLLTGDAVYTHRTIDEGLCRSTAPTSTSTAVRCARSRATLASHPGDLVICGHDAERWRQLEPVYA